jgi:anti-sigma regulatory factor (Ser/Thr protein kinase)
LRLHQVLVNLVGNAVKFTEEGEVRVSVQCRDAQTSAPVLCIVVSDTGIGIEASQIERIFAPFAQADGSITRRFGGTGLGLSISRRLAELMGGTLSVRSTPGYGAEFTLQVPFSPVEQAPPGGTPHLAPTAAPDRITAAGPTTVAPEPASAPPAVPQRQADLVVLQPLLTELDDLLSRNMLSARGVAEQVRAELQGTAWAEGFSDIEQDVSRLRFPAARARLAFLRAQWAEASSGPETTASA